MKRSMMILFTLVCLAGGGMRLSAQVAVIANKSLSFHTIDLQTLRSLYFLDAKEADGTTVKLFCFKDENGATVQFFTAMGKSFNDTKKIWIRMKLTGNGEPPSAVASDEEMIAKVEATPGAIGFVAADKVSGKVKVLLTVK